MSKWNADNERTFHVKGPHVTFSEITTFKKFSQQVRYTNYTSILLLACPIKNLEASRPIALSNMIERPRASEKGKLLWSSRVKTKKQIVKSQVWRTQTPEWLHRSWFRHGRAALYAAFHIDPIYYGAQALVVPSTWHSSPPTILNKYRLFLSLLHFFVISAAFVIGH